MSECGKLMPQKGGWHQRISSSQKDTDTVKPSGTILSQFCTVISLR
jgi:hypothetical protein